MAFEQKPSSGSAFKNDRKTEDKHSDFSGTYKDSNGKDHWFNMWRKTDKNGNEFFSFTTKPKS